MQGLSIPTEEQLLHFLEKHARDRLELEFVVFWGRHPSTRFSRGVISCVLGYNKRSIDRALEEMVESGLVDTYDCNGVPVYALTADDEKRRPVMELASLSWDQLQRMVRCVKQTWDADQLTCPRKSVQF